MPSEPCICWLADRCTNHSGHCCFGYPDPTGELYQHGKTPPCGHWHHAIPRPEQADA